MLSFPATTSGLVLVRDVRAAGREAELRAAIAAGDLVTVRRGVYREASAARSEDSTPDRNDRRYLAVVHAAAEVLVDPVFTSFSAIALHGLPIFGQWPRDVYVLSGNKTGHRRSGLIAVASARAAPRTTAIAGIRCTTIEYSLLQLCRHATLAAALTAMDAALRVPRFGPARPMTTLARLRREHERLLPYHGSRRAEAVLARATHLADTPLETVSRLVIEELGFAKPQLQHRLWLPELNQEAFLDFLWPDVNAGAEADGVGKYLAGVKGLEAASIVSRAAAAEVIKEKERENAVRRQLRAFDRWNWAETLARAPVERRLTAMGIPRPRPPRILFGDQDASAARRIRRSRRASADPS